MNPHRNVVVRYVFPAGPERELLEQCDDLVVKAASGDARALSAVVVTFGQVLVGVARRELGAKWESDAEDVVQEIYAAMALGTLASAASGLELGEGLPWLKRLVRELLGAALLCDVAFAAEDEFCWRQRRRRGRFPGRRRRERQLARWHGGEQLVVGHDAPRGRGCTRRQR